MTYFAERQRFRQPWFVALLLGAAALFWWGAIQQLLLGRPWGTDPAPDLGLLLVWLLTGVVLPVLLLSARLDTEVRDTGIHLRFVPFHRRERSWGFHEIQSIEAREYRPIREFGGWGIRWGLGGKAYNVSGRQGIQLVLHTGERILIGTRRPDRFMAAYERARRRESV